MEYGKKKIIYDSKTRLLYDDKHELRSKRLGILEGKLLMLLSGDNFYSFEDINKFLYGKQTIVVDAIRDEIVGSRYREIRFNEDVTNNQIRLVIQRLKKKLLNFKELTIKNRNGIGYYLKGDLYIE